VQQGAHIHLAPASLRLECNSVNTTLLWTQDLIDKIANLNASIDEVSDKLKTNDKAEVSA